MHDSIRHNPLALTAFLVVGLMIASSWLVFPYFVQGRQLLRAVGDDSRAIKGTQVSQYLTRTLARSPDIELTATYASDEFFQFVDRAAVVADLRPDRNFVFFINETIHRGELPQQVPDAVLHVGAREFAPVAVSGPRTAEHHRLTIVSFPKRDEAGAPIDIDSARTMRLTVSSPYFESERPLTFNALWDAPYSLPPELKSRAGITPVAVLALGAGLLSAVLTPCLLQLVVIFGSVLAAFSTVPGAAPGGAPQVTAAVRRRIMPIALAFVVGFAVLYAAAGAVIGGLGQRAQLLFAEQSRTVAVVAGLVVIAIGLGVGLRGTRNLACRLPERRAAATLSLRDQASTLLASMAYALGCTACFGGAIVGTLLVYVGAIGSATIGAGVMLIFATGVAIPFLLSAFYLSKLDTVVEFLAGNARTLSFASMVLIVAFGLILVTDNFHTVSDFLYPYLGLN